MIIETEDSHQSFYTIHNVEVTGYTDVVNVKVRERNQICVLLFEPEQ